MLSSYHPLFKKLLSLEPSNTVKRFILASFPFLVIVVFELYSPKLLFSQDIALSGMANYLAISYFALMLFGLTPRQRLMALIFVPFSLIGEYVFSIVFDFYSYRLGHIPIYVPFGHAILFSMGVLVCETQLIRRYEEKLRPLLVGLFIGLFVLVVTLFHDTFSAACALVLLWVLRRKGYNTLYFVMGLLVLYIEVLGTTWGCWLWKPYPISSFAWLQTTNPPLGAFVFYVLGDLGVMKITRLFSQKFLPSNEQGATAIASSDNAAMLTSEADIALSEEGSVFCNP